MSRQTRRIAARLIGHRLTWMIAGVLAGTVIGYSAGVVHRLPLRHACRPPVVALASPPVDPVPPLELCQYTEAPGGGWVSGGVHCPELALDGSPVPGTVARW